MVKVLETPVAKIVWSTEARCMNSKCNVLLYVTAQDLYVDRQGWLLRWINGQDLVARFMCPNCHIWQPISEYEMRRLGYDNALSLKNNADVARDKYWSIGI